MVTNESKEQTNEKLFFFKTFNLKVIKTNSYKLIFFKKSSLKRPVEAIETYHYLVYVVQQKERQT